MYTQLSDCKKAIRKTANIQLVSERIEAINKCLNGYGVEVIRSSENWHHYYGDIVAEYVNMGDAYAPTVLYDIHKGRFIVTTWEDWFEKNEKKYSLY